MAQTYRAADWAALVLGIVMVLIGLVLGAGGAWLLWLGGSFYYLPSGIVLIVSGVLLARRRVDAQPVLMWTIPAFSGTPAQHSG